MIESAVANSVENFIRGTVIPLTLLFKLLRDNLHAYYTPSLGDAAAKSAGMIYGALIVGVITIVIALIALRFIDETYGRDMNFVEED